MSEPIITLDAFMKEMRLQLDWSEAHVQSIRANDSGRAHMPDLPALGWLGFLLYEIATFSHDVEFRDAAAVFVEMLRHKRMENRKTKLSSGSTGSSPSLADRVAKLETETRAMCTGCQREGYYRNNPKDFSMSPTECNIHGTGKKVDALAVARDRIAYLEGVLLGLGAEATVAGGPGGREVG